MLLRDSVASSLSLLKVLLRSCLTRLSKPSRWIILCASVPLVCVTFYLFLWPVPEDPPPQAAMANEAASAMTTPADFNLTVEGSFRAGTAMSAAVRPGECPTRGRR